MGYQVTGEGERQFDALRYLVVRSDLFVILTYFDKSSANREHERVREVLMQLVPRRMERLGER